VESDGDLLAEVLRLGLERLTEAERDAYANAEPHERSEERQARRNGYRTRILRTRGGRAGAGGAPDPGRRVLLLPAGAVSAQ